jgi:hypothetical protein
MNRKNNHQFTIAEALQLITGDKRLHKGLTESAVKQQWKDIMGETIARHTTAIYLKGTELLVYFNSSVIKNEFIYNKDKAVKLINEGLGYDAITDLVIK